MTDSRTATPPSVVEALSRVMESVRSVAKNQRNEQQKFLFRGIDAVMNAVGPALREHRVVIVPEVLAHDLVGSKTGNDKPINVCRVKVTYHVYGPAGDTLSGTVAAESMDSGDKATAKAMSVAYRTFLLQALTLPTDEPDPDESSYNHARPMPPQQQPVERDWLAEAVPLKGNVPALQNLWREARAFHASPAILKQIEALAKPQPKQRDFISEIDDADGNVDALRALHTAAMRAGDETAAGVIQTAITAAMSDSDYDGPQR